MNVPLVKSKPSAQLTAMQRTLLTSHFAFPDKGHQNAAFLIRFEDHIDVERVTNAFASVVVSSDVLRTRISKDGGGGLEIAEQPPAATAIKEMDRGEFAAWAEQQANQALNLSRAAYESVICCHPDGTVSWYLNIHHLVNDGPSAALVLRAVDAAYQDTPMDLKDFYADDWSVNLSLSEGSAAKEYWQKRAPAPRIERLYDNLGRATADAEQHPVLPDTDIGGELATHLTGSYRLLTENMSRTAFWTFATALYLHRLSGANEFSIGVIINHRSHLSADNVIGPMLEIFPVDIVVELGDTHQSLHRRVCKAFFQTLKNARPGTAPAPDYDALVNVMPESVAPTDLFGSRAEVCWLYSGSLDGAIPLRLMDTPYRPLSDDLRWKKRQIDLAITDDARGDCNPEAARDHFGKLVQQALSHPDKSIFGYSLASEDEIQLLSDWGSEPGPEETFDLRDRLERMLKDNSQIVLIEEDQELTGDALWNWSVNFASHLIRENAPIRIGVQMTPSIQSLVAIYGILLSGRSYVPIEPNSPPGRVENIITVTELEYVLKETEEVDRTRSMSATELPPWVQDEEAYVFFTSGSSGTPRGVAISKAGLDNYLNIIVERVRRRAGRPVAPLFGSLSFDITVNMLFAPILAGGTLHVFGGHPADAMVRIARTSGLTWLQATPAHLEILIRLLPKDHSLRTIVSGGDALGGRLAKLLDQSNPGADLLLVNYYGPTETVVGCADYELTKEDRNGLASVPIGKPLPGAILAVMDGAGNRVPPGAIGELWISFPHMMESYIGWESEPSGITRHEGVRFYRSGDLAHYRQDGNLVFHGRRDDQMKIGGIRIDPTEIQDALNSHPAVRRSVVRLHGVEDDGQPILTAWIEPSGVSAARTELRSYLRSRVPQFAIPRAFVEISEFPLNSSGKLEIANLPVPAKEEALDKTGSAGQISDLERRIMAVWQEVLDVEVQSPHDDFFVLGGESLSALEMILALGKELGQNLDERLAFQETTPAGLSKAIELSRNLGDDRAPAESFEVVARTYSEADPPPLTDYELSILLHHRAEPQSDRYNGGRIIRVSDRIDPEKFRVSMAKIVERHVPLTWTYGNPRQPLPLAKRFDFSNGIEPIEFAALENLIEEIRRQPFDLDNGPILRCHVQHLTEGGSAIAFVGHHVGFDYISFDILWTQIIEDMRTPGQIYEPLDYPGVADKLLDSCRTEAQEFWRAQEIPPQAPLKPMKAEVGGSQGLYLSRELSLQPEQIKRVAGGSVVHRALASAAIAISPFVDGKDIDLAVVGSRASDNDDQTVGCFTNQLPVWLNFGQESQLDDVLSQAAGKLADLFPFRNFPFSQVDAEQQRSGTPFEKPRFLVSVIDPPDWGHQDETFDDKLLSSNGAVAPMSFFLIFGRKKTEVGLEYDKRIFSDAVASQVLENFSAAIHAVVEGANAPVSSITSKLLKPSILIGDPLDEQPGVFDQIAGHLQQAGSNEAIACNDENDWDWLELSKRVGAIAGALKRAGVGPGNRVAIALPRGPIFVAAILAVMGRRATYVPIDKTYPKERIQAVISAAKPDLCLTDAPSFDRPELLIDHTGIDGIRWSDVVRESLLSPLDDEIAYIMFTSGSTGKPVGVPITHAQLSHSTNARKHVYDAKPTRFGLFSSLAFDSSIVGLFWTLSRGGTIVLPDEHALRDPLILAGMFGQDLSHCLAVPTLYSALLDHLRTPWPQHVILAGEVLPLALAKRHFEAAPETPLTNEYGPTEATVWSLWYAVDPDASDVPIGHPVPGTWAAVVDEEGKPVQAGVSGQLILGGALVANGYISDPELTEKKFDEDAGPSLPAGPVFRTGDRAVLGPGGFHYLGRADRQINLGGIRLEPAEVESILEVQSGVERAIVLAKDMRTKEQLMVEAPLAILRQAIDTADTNDEGPNSLENNLRQLMPSDAALVAHIQSSVDLDVAELRRLAASKLPIIQRPKHYILHEAFPTTPNGKIDMLRLGETELEASSDNILIQPNERVENSENVAIVTRLFQEALDNPALGPDDSFFEFGGYSLLALQVILSIEEQLGLQLSTADLYEMPTARELCRNHLPTTKSEIKKASQQSIVIPFCKSGSKPPIFAIHNLETNGDLYRPLVSRLGPDQPFYGIGHLQKPNMTESEWVQDPNWATRVKDVASGYLTDLERIAPTGPVVLVGFCLGAVYAFEMAQQLRAKGREPDCLVMLNDLHAPELHIHTSSRAGSILASRWDQLKRARIDALPRILGKLPTFANRGWKELERQVEKLMLKRAQSKNQKLSRRLQARQFLETSYLEVQSYEYDTYPGRSLILRDKDRGIAHGREGNNGWGTRLPNAEIKQINCKLFESFMEEPHVGLVAEAIEQTLDQEKESIEEVSLTKKMTKESWERKRILKPNYSLLLEHAKEGFVDAPRAAQRDWLVQRRLQELADELEHLTKQAPSMIAATGTVPVDGRGTTKISGEETMEDWQIPVMQRMADAVSQRGAHILEIGFGRGVSANMVQAHDVATHTIVECNPHIIEEFENWRAGYPDRDIKMIEGLWQDVIEQFGQYDGILFHTYPLETEELVKSLAKYSTFAEEFFPVAAKSLHQGGRFTYYTNEADSFSRAHQRALLRHFDSYSISRLDGLEIPSNSADAHWFDTITIVEATAG